jgi:putative transposase
MREKPYWGNHFWSRGYCVSTIGLDEEKIRRYVKFREQREKQAEKEQKEFGPFLRPRWRNHRLSRWLFTEQRCLSATVGESMSPFSLELRFTDGV